MLQPRAPPARQDGWLARWDQGSKRVRAHLLRSFIERYEADEAPRDASLALVLSRLTAWLRLTYATGASTLSMHVRAIHIAVQNCLAEPDALRDFLQESTALVLLELASSASDAEVRIEALRLLHTLATHEGFVRALFCQFHAPAAARECLTTCDDARVHKHARELFFVLATDNLEYASACTIELLHLLQGPSARARETAARLAADLIDGPTACVNASVSADDDTDHPGLASFIGPALALTQERFAWLQVAGENLLHRLLRYPGLFGEACEAMLETLYALRLESLSEFKSPGTMPASTRLLAQLKRVVASGSPDELSTLCANGAIRALVGCVLNIHNYELQRVALETCRALCGRVDSAEAVMAELLGTDISARIAHGNTVQDGLIVREFIQDEQMYTKVADNLLRVGWDLGHSPEMKPQHNKAAMLAFPDDDNDDGEINDDDDEEEEREEESEEEEEEKEPEDERGSETAPNLSEPGDADSVESDTENSSEKVEREVADNASVAVEDAQRATERQEENLRTKDKYSSFRRKLDVDLRQASPTAGLTTQRALRLPLSQAALKERTESLLPYVGLYVPSKKPHPKLLSKHLVRFTQKMAQDPRERRQQQIRHLANDSAEVNESETLNFIKGLALVTREEDMPIPSQEALDSAQCEVLADIPLRFLPHPGAAASFTTSPADAAPAEAPGPEPDAEAAPSSPQSTTSASRSHLQQKLEKRRARAEEIRLKKETLRKEKAAAAKSARLLARQQKSDPNAEETKPAETELPTFEHHVLLDLAIQRERRRVVSPTPEALAQTKKKEPPPSRKKGALPAAKSRAGRGLTTKRTKKKTH